MWLQYRGSGACEVDLHVGFQQAAGHASGICGGDVQTGDAHLGVISG